MPSRRGPAAAIAIAGPGRACRGPTTSLSLNDIKARPATTITVILDCAGNGRALLTPRPISQPWLLGAVGTAEWTGVPLRGLLDEAGLRDDATEIVFSGSDRGVEGGHVHAFERSLSRDEA